MEPQAFTRVDKIVGPGNLYVTAAKRLVAFDCAIDMLAGPTEIVVTSERGHATEIASDLVAQAEHDPEALAIFVTTRIDLAKAVIAEAKLRSRLNPIARQALDRNGLVIIASTVTRRVRSPIVWRRSTSPSMPQAISIGCRTQARSSWAAGPRSPWATTSPAPITRCPPAAWRECVAASASTTSSSSSPCKQYTAQGMRTLGPPAALLAEAEGLTGHAEAIRMRLAPAVRQTRLAPHEVTSRQKEKAS